MKTKTKMPKAMYGKTMMKKGGIKKMQDGGAMSKLEKGIRKAAGYNVKEGTTEGGDKYTIARKTKASGKNKVIAKVKDADGITTTKKIIYKNSSESPSEIIREKTKVSNPQDYSFPNESLEGNAMKRGGSVKKMKKGGMVKRKMMTGGMANPNAKVSYQTVAGSKGVTSGVNPKASASKVASSRGTGGVNTPPSKATPAAKRGGAVKMKRGGMIKRK